MKILDESELDSKLLEQMSTVRISLQTKPEYTFFVSVMLRLKTQFSFDIPTACTDGNEITFNPDFIKTLTNKELAFLYMHETMHVIYGHMLRIGNKDHRQWNVACDYIINNMLDDLGFNVIKGGMLNHKYDNMTSDQVYAKIVEDEKNNKTPPQQPMFNDLKAPQSNQQGNGVPDPNGSGHSSSGVPSAQSTQQAIQDLVDAATIQSMQSGQKGYGSIPADILREYQERTRAVIDWKAELANFMFAIGRNGMSYKKPSRRTVATGITLPGRHGKGLGRIDFAIDTSGSITDEIFNAFISEISFVFEKLKPKHVGVMQFDHEIKSNNTINKATEFKNIKFNGGGGTYLEPVMQEFIGSPSKALIVLTDGYFSNQITNPNKPVVWAVFDNPKWKPPFGRVVHFDLDALLESKKNN